VFDQLSRSELESIVHSATLAPSVLNIQPWRFLARSDGVIEVHRDRARALPVLDPRHRALIISCGAALFNLRLAVAAAGRLPEVQLLPSASDGTLLATVRAAERVAPSSTDIRLYGSLSRRRTTRLPFVNQPIAPEMIMRLEAVASTERARLRILDLGEATRAADLVHQADAAMRSDPAVRREIARWTNRESDAVDGIPAPALGPAAHDPDSLVRDFAMGAHVDGRGSAAFEQDPTLAVVLTEDDEPASWLRAGLALERVWLEATAAGLAISLLTQPLELPHLRWLARPMAPMGARPVGPTTPDTASWSGPPAWPQVLFRIGNALGSAVPTPRRPVGDVLRFESDLAQPIRR
jgi:nitroreductase